MQIAVTKQRDLQSALFIQNITVKFDNIAERNLTVERERGRR